MDKRVVIAIALCVVIWMVFAPKKAEQEPTQTTQTGEQQQQIAAQTGQQKVAVPASSIQKTTSQANLVKSPKLAEKRTVLENDDFSCAFTNHGAKLVSIKLNKFKKTLTPDSENIELIFDNLNKFGVPGWSFVINDSLYKDSEIYYYTKTQTKNNITYLVSIGPVAIEKTFSISDDGYLINSKLKVKNTSNRKISLTPYLELPQSMRTEEKKTSFFFGYPNKLSAVVNINDKIKRVELGKASDKDAQELFGNIRWLGVDDKYFIKAVMPTLTLGEQILFEKDESDFRNVKLRYPLKEIPSGGEKEFGFNLYAGPKEITRLEALGNNFYKAIDLGDWIGPIARPILSLLKWIHKYIPNYGLAIILLTILVKMLLYPISRKQYKSMEGMKKLQPQISALKEKFKGDKQKLNVETMNLFKTHKVNPMSGCFPMLLQMPVFFALYRVLYNSIELRHSPFVFWITDLSAPDPYYITPILMGVTMYLQQTLMPQPSTDPTQAKVMKFMPIMFALFMLALPSGLVIYIFVSSLLSVVTQQFKNIRKGGSSWNGKNLVANLLPKLKKKQ